MNTRPRGLGSFGVANKTMEELTRNTRATSSIWVLYDYMPFHGGEFVPGARNFLYADGHVEN